MIDLFSFNSEKYWNRRYRSGGDSGYGSQGLYAVVKATIINDFVQKHHILTVCDLGCGDRLFKLFKFTYYIGYDASDYIIKRNKRDYSYLNFTSLMDDLAKYDLTLSIDVIFHLIEDKVYKQYMIDLFRLSNKYVIIYSPNRDEVFKSKHNRYREFIKDIPDDFELFQFIDNPYKGQITQSDWYIFKKK